MKLKIKSILIATMVAAMLLMTVDIPPLTGRAASGLTLDPLYTDNMVLQRDQEVKISGSASANEEITVEFKGQKKTCIADENGKFSVKLDPMSADKTGAKLYVSNGVQRVTYSNVLVGEVIYGSGQSNMAYPIDEFKYAYNLIKSDESYGEDYTKYNNQEYFLKKLQEFKNYNILRFFTVKMLPETNGVVNKGIQNRWIAPNGLSELDYVSFTAVAFAVNLSEKLNVPVGVIISAVGGSQVHEWISRDAVNQIFPGNGDSSLCRRYENMVLPMGSYTIKAVLWYQGESDVYSTISTYKDCFKAWLKETREFFGDENLPVITYLLPQFEDQYCKGLWPAFRQVQIELANECENVYYVNGIDLGDHTNIHPLDKYEFNDRATGLALKYIYNQAYGGSGAYGKNPEVATLYKKSGSKTVYATFTDVNEIHISDGVRRGLIGTSNQQAYTNIENFEKAGIKTVSFETKLKFVSYLQNNIFDYDTAFMYNEYGLPVAPFVLKGITAYDYDVTVNFSGCTVDNDRFFITNGGEIKVKVTPDENTVLKSLTVDGQSVNLNDNNEIVVENITKDMVISVVYEKDNSQNPDDSSSDSSSDTDSTQDTDSSSNSSEPIDSGSDGSSESGSSSSDNSQVKPDKKGSCKGSICAGEGIAFIGILSAMFVMKKRKE